jgi:putative holliday junction resolvase
MSQTSASPEIVILGFDFGTVRIGIAIGNSLTRQARPLSTIRSPVNQVRFQTIESLIKEWQVKLLIVGKPVHPDGNPHEMTARATRFANQLYGRFKLPVCLVDERYSSAVAEDEGADRYHIDERSAEIILQQFFDETTDLHPLLQTPKVTQSHEKPTI